MRNKKLDTLVSSQPTMCLSCHLIITMFHGRNADPIKGAWQCPTCGHLYKFAYWKIKKAKQHTRQKTAKELEKEKEKMERRKIGFPDWSDVWEKKRHARQ